MKNTKAMTNRTEMGVLRGGSVRRSANRGSAFLLSSAAALLLVGAMPGMAQAQSWTVAPNQAPYRPTVHGPYNTWDQPTAIDPTFGGMVKLSWRTNGDPDGDLVGSSVQVLLWDQPSEQWVVVVNTVVASTTNEFVYGLKYSAGDLLPGRFYIWKAFAIDSSQRSNPWYSESEWQMFATPAQQTPPPQGGETLVVPADQKKTLTSQPLQAGRRYIIEVSGTFGVWSKLAEGVDAVYHYRDGKPAKWNQLRIDDKGLVDMAGEIPYNPQHVYRINYTGQGKPLSFRVLDAYSSPSDNGGAITVRIIPQ